MIGLVGRDLVTSQQKMSNPAFMSVCIEGDRRQIRSLHGKMLRLQNRKNPLIDNGFYYPKRWLDNLVARLGGRLSRGVLPRHVGLLAAAPWCTDV